MKAAIFTIGTEVVDGEIVNTNASWLAQQLDHYGFAVTHHVSTSDRVPDMKEVLAWLVKKVDWVFVSGGLGPTSDDRTRDVVADVVGDRLVFSEEVWARLEESYRARGFTLTEDHRRQCYFPQHCRKLDNPVGSALGFVSESGNTRIIVLPGPPTELKGVFAQAVEPDIRDLRLKKATLHRWVCLGITESGAAERVEAAVGGQGLDIGYRAVIPYVHVKVWIPEERARQPIIDTVDEAIGEYRVDSGTDDPGRVFTEALSALPLWDGPERPGLVFSDCVSDGRLVVRLSELGVFDSYSVSFRNGPNGDDGVLFTLAADEREHTGSGGHASVRASVRIGGVTQELLLRVPPYNKDLTSPRVRGYYAEQALHAWARIVRTGLREIPDTP